MLPQNLNFKKIRTKSIILGFISIFLLSFAPKANALDVPLLSWERGKEQNIVLGGPGVPSTWQIKLESKDTSPLIFNKSATNAKGFVVYSVFVPANYPTGAYTVRVYGPGAEEGSLVAGVSVIALATYSVTEIPTDLRIVLLGFIGLYVIFAFSRNRKSSTFFYARKRNLVEDSSLTYDTRFPKWLYRIYRLRVSSVENLPRGLFWFLFKKDGNDSHRLSPLSWVITPIVGVISGFASGIYANQNVLKLNIFIFVFLALIGIIDSYSGVLTSFSFATAQIIIGDVTNLKEILILIGFGLAWSLLGIFGSSITMLSKRKIDSVIAPFFVTAFSYFLLTLANTFASKNVRPNREDILISLIMGIFFALKNWFITKRTNDLDLNLVTENYKATSKIDSSFIIGVAIWFILIGYIWIGAWNRAFLSGLIMTLPVILLNQKFNTPKISILSKWRRDIYVELIGVGILTYLVFIIVGKQPLLTYQKSELLFIVGFIPLLLYIAIGRLYDLALGNEIGEDA